MTTTVDETISSEQLIELAPPFLLRVGAALIDYIVFLLLPLAGLVSERALGGMGFGLFSDRTIWLLACVIGFINCVILPQVSGQSLGKLMTGIRIVKRDGTQISRFALFVRQTLGYLITLATLGLGFLVCAILPSGPYGLAATYGKRFRGVAPPVIAAGQLSASTLLMLPVSLMLDSP